MTTPATPDDPTRSDAVKRPLRVLIGCDTFAPDINGAARFAERLAAGLVARGHDVHVIAPNSAYRKSPAHTEVIEGEPMTMHRLPWRSRAPWMQAWRSLMLAGANLMFSSALPYLPLADATAIGFASPLLTVALAAVWLRERVSARRWLGVAIGLAGVMVALRPPFLTGFVPDWGYLLPLGTALGFAWYQILTRRLAALDDARVTIFHTGLAATLAASLLQPFVFDVVR